MIEIRKKNSNANHNAYRLCCKNVLASQIVLKQQLFSPLNFSFIGEVKKHSSSVAELSRPDIQPKHVRKSILVERKKAEKHILQRSINLTFAKIFTAKQTVY